MRSIIGKTSALFFLYWIFFFHNIYIQLYKHNISKILVFTSILENLWIVIRMLDREGEKISAILCAVNCKIFECTKLKLHETVRGPRVSRRATSLQIYLYKLWCFFIESGSVVPRRHMDHRWSEKFNWIFGSGGLIILMKGWVKYCFFLILLYNLSCKFTKIHMKLRNLNR